MRKRYKREKDKNVSYHPNQTSCNTGGLIRTDNITDFMLSFLIVVVVLLVVVVVVVVVAVVVVVVLVFGCEH